ncbi:MAG TPA: phosphatase PAP2 family protein [Anaerolineales bacterium]|nr:phosphatase PAP2 family protein [Anaerolineales bacterium]
MKDWLQWGTGLLVAWQSGGSQLVGNVMQSFTFLGSEWFYMLVMPAVLWCFSASLGMRLGLLLLTSATLNTICKLALALPRPFWVDERVRALSVETSFGLPSGHAQNAVVLWGYLAYTVRRWWATLAAILLILAISFSRLYLGVHFPGDVLAGWIVGALVLAVFLLLERPVGRWLKRRSLATRLLLTVAFSLGFLALGWLASNLSARRALPPTWADNFHRALGASVPFRPGSLDDLVAGAGALLGFAAGAVVLDEWGKFTDVRGAWPRLARFFLGVVVVLALQVGLSAVLPDGDAFRFLRYALLGGWISYGAPRLFFAIGLRG